MDDKITEAAKTAGFDWADLGVRDRLAFERFYAIATQRQQERITELEAQVQALTTRLAAAKLGGLLARHPSRS